MTAHDCTARELVGGSASRPAEERGPALTDPDTGLELHGQLASSADCAERVLATAHAVHVDEVWTRLSRAERGTALRALGDALSVRVDELAHADSLDTGVPLATTRALLGAVCGAMAAAADQVEAGFGHAEHASASGTCDQWRLPWGPALVLLPWNAPTAMAVTRTADALVAGCPVVLKPSEWSPHSTGPFSEAVSAALPAGVVQVVHGDRAVSAALVDDRRTAAVSFTGGVAGGRAVAETCGRLLKPVDLELSGNNPVVVLPDADPAAVVANVLPALLFLNGQYCAGPRRLVVPRDRASSFVDALGDSLDGLSVGPTTDPTAALGPLASAQHLAHVRRQLDEFARRGCDVRHHGRVPEGDGHYLPPTVVLADAAPDLVDEVFGPVLVVRTYDDVDEAVGIANDQPYGLTAYVVGDDRDRAREVGRRLRAGLVRVNSPFGPDDVAPVGSPWGASGLGSFGPGEGPRFFSGSRFVG